MILSVLDTQCLSQSIIHWAENSSSLTGAFSDLCIKYVNGKVSGNTVHLHSLTWVFAFVIWIKPCFCVTAQDVWFELSCNAVTFYGEALARQSSWLSSEESVWKPRTHRRPYAESNSSNQTSDTHSEHSPKSSFNIFFLNFTQFFFMILLQSPEENKELNRRIAVHIVNVCEQLFLHYLQKAEGMYAFWFFLCLLVVSIRITYLCK